MHDFFSENKRLLKQTAPGDEYANILSDVNRANRNKFHQMLFHFGYRQIGFSHFVLIFGSRSMVTRLSAAVECGVAGEHYDTPSSPTRAPILPRTAWVRRNRLRTGVGIFRSCLHICLSRKGFEELAQTMKKKTGLRYFLGRLIHETHLDYICNLMELLINLQQRQENFVFEFR